MTTIDQAERPDPHTFKEVVITATQQSASPSSKSIAWVARHCAQLFVQPDAVRDCPKAVKLDFDTQLSRFKIWAGNLGVFSTPGASADRRLRNDPERKDVLISMLTRLAEKLQTFIETPRPLKLIENITKESHDAENTSSSSSSSSSSLVLDSDVDSEDGDDVQEETQVRHPLLKDIENIISHLYRFSTIIRKPIPSNEKERVRRYIEREQVELDLPDLELWVRWKLPRDFPRLKDSPKLLERLVNGALYRRAKIMYRASHQEKLEDGTEEWFFPRNPQSIDGDLASMPEVLEFSQEAEYTAKVSGKAVAFAETEPSVVPRAPISADTKSGILSGITMTAVGRRERLDIPPMPREFVGELRCPYCSQIITEELKGRGKVREHLWRRHVLRDIDPYVCLFEDCDLSSEQFKTTEEWINHMMWQHTTLYSCQVPGHEKHFFASAPLFEQHLKHEHHDTFPDQQLGTVVEEGLRPAPDVFASLAACLNEDHKGIPESLSLCPMCTFCLADIEVPPGMSFEDFSIASFPKNLYQEIKDHMAEHLETIALLSLPGRDDLDEVEEESSEQISGMSQDLDYQKDEDLPPLTAEDFLDGLDEAVGVSSEPISGPSQDLEYGKNPEFTDPTIEASIESKYQQIVPRGTSTTGSTGTKPFEVVGLILAYFPLIISHLEDVSSHALGLSGTLRTSRRTETRSVLTSLSVQHAIFKNSVSKIIVSLPISSERASELLQTPDSSSWGDEHLHEALQTILGSEGAIFSSLFERLQDDLTSLGKEFRLEQSRASSSNVNSLKKFLRRFEVNIGSKRVGEYLQRISKYNEKIESLLRSLTKPDQPQRVRKEGRNQEITRYHTLNLFTLLSQSFDCHCTSAHEIYLELNSRKAATKNTYEKLSLVFGPCQGTRGTGRTWMRSIVTTEKAPNSQASTVSESPKTVSFRDTPSSSHLLVSTEITDLCSAIQSGQQYQDSIGYLRSSDWYYLLSESPQYSPDRDGVLVSLDKVVFDATRRQRYVIAAVLARELLRLYDTPWLSSTWKLSDIVTEANTTTPDRWDAIGDRLLIKYLGANRRPRPDDSFATTSRNSLVRNETLFSLGVALIELALSKPLLSFQKAEDLVSGDVGLTEYLVALRLIEEVCEDAGQAYGNAVQWCIRGESRTGKTSFDDESFRLEYYDRVVQPLEEQCQGWKV